MESADETNIADPSKVEALGTASAAPAADDFVLTVPLPEKADGLVIADGSSVIIDQNDERQSFLHVKSDGNLTIGHKTFPADILIGTRFGASFEVIGDKLVPYNKITVQDSAAQRHAERQCDNRNLVDGDNAQTLSEGDIEEMQKSGQSGAEIINALVANSTTFAAKTAFSQEKYLKKKKRKYCTIITVLRPTHRTICKTLFAKSPYRIHHLRHDALALMLNMSNVGAGARVLVVETCGGLITGSVAERLGGHGVVCASYEGEKPPARDLVRYFNFDEAHMSSITSLSLQALRHGLAQAAANPAPAQGAEPVDAAQEAAGMEATASSDSAAEDARGGNPGASCGTEPPASSRQGVKVSGRIRAPSTDELATWAHEGFSSMLLVAPQLEPAAAVAALMPMLQPSAPFVVFSNYLQPLAECMQDCQLRKVAVGLQLSEPWMRIQQVLPMRTHPMMSMSGTGGYLLCGTRTAGVS
ncbi:hypothetical protein CYMTET_19000 [Cymbomonas tetramitiformis]|uniref:tRNA (adenine(58)-N(1))-methyltransferase non-catalytic subunit TRM6 n=1 Tax=Cymbomonas tetramitiformis TaxID=36881 RepID=A0AAE0L5P7_9CHLO|nr:hypothetical protein CYMTET_19000 [Cymbomonas tetramitiformis]